MKRAFTVVSAKGGAGLMGPKDLPAGDIKVCSAKLRDKGKGGSRENESCKLNLRLGRRNRVGVKSGRN